MENINIESKLNWWSRISLTPKKLAPAKAGIDKKKAIFDDSTLSNFKNLEAVITIPDLLTPGIIAIIPGVSRSGIVITASRFLKFDRVESSKIAFFLSIPALAGASFLGVKDILDHQFNFDSIFIFSTLSSFVFSYVTIKYFLIYVKMFSLNFFVIYRIILSLILFSIVYL